MNTLYNPRLKPFSRQLRKNMTREESHLWYDFLKKLPVTVKRQKIIGDYIVDFYCSKAHLVIEIDGSYHYEQEQALDDINRDKFLEDNGMTVLRYTNKRINEDFLGVCGEIEQYINEKISGVPSP